MATLSRLNLFLKMQHINCNIIVTGLLTFLPDTKKDLEALETRL